MNFKEAVAQIIQTESEDRTQNAFYLYSRLSDLCPSYEDKKKIELFFQIDQHLHIVNAFQTQGRSAAAVLKAAYPAVQAVLPFEGFEKLLDAIVEACFPPPGQDRKAAPKPKQKVVQKGAVTQAPNRTQPQTRTPLGNAPRAPQTPHRAQPAPAPAQPYPTTPHFPAAPRKHLKPFLIALAIILGVGALVAGIVCICLFGNWTVWQYVIGAAGGLILCGVGYGIAYALNEASGYEIELYHSATVLLLLTAIANGVLFGVFHEKYLVIFIFISAYCLIAGVVSSIAAFSDVEDGWGWLLIVETLLIAVQLTLQLLNFYLTISWTVWQYILGAGGGLLLAGVGACIAFLLEDGPLIEWYKTTFVATLIVGIANIVLFGVLQGACHYVYQIIFIFISAYCLLASLIATICAFDDVEDEWGWALIVEMIVFALALIFELIFLWVK